MKRRFLIGLSVCSGIMLTAPAALATDEVLYWNAVHLNAIKTAGGAGAPPPKASRGLAIQSIAAYDASNAISRSHQSYAYTGVAAVGANRNAAIARASYETLKALYPTQNFDAMYQQRMALIADGQAKADGIAVGAAAANAILTRRATDGSTNNAVYTGSNEPGKWRSTPGGAPSGLLPLWGSVAPFALQSGSQFRPGPPPSLTTNEYAEALNEVKLIGGTNSPTRTVDQGNIAKFWAAGGGTVTPPGMWNQIAQTVATQRLQNTEENARMFALLNIAAADSAISCWDTKYVYETWRPVTAIREAGSYGNAATEADPTWTPLITTPSFPSFTSGHSTFSAAAAEILGSFVGSDDFAFSATTDFAGVDARSFLSFRQAAEEAAMSRLYGGIHFRFDNEVGTIVGQKIGQEVYSTQLQAVPEPMTMAALGLGVAALARRRRAKDVSGASGP
jgi:hypothetical protein